MGTSLQAAASTLAVAIWALWAAAQGHTPLENATSPASQGFVWCASRAQAMASITIAFFGAGCAILAAWAPLQPSSRDEFMESCIVTLVGLAMTLGISFYGFRSFEGCVALAVIYLNVWHAGSFVAFRFHPEREVDAHSRTFEAITIGQLVVLLLEIVTEAMCALTRARKRVLQTVAAFAAVAWIYLRFEHLFWLRNSASLGTYWFMSLMTCISLLFLAFELRLQIFHAREALILENETKANQQGEVAEQDQASLLSRYTFWWILPTLRTANQAGRLDAGDLPRLPQQDAPRYLFERFRDEWQGKTLTGWNLLVKICYSVQRPVFFSSMLHGWAYQALMLLDPIVLNKLLKSAEHGASESMSGSLVLVGLLSVSMFIRVTFMEICFFASLRVNNNARSVLVATIFRKVLRGEDTPAYDSGSLTNLMATDADKLGRMAWMTFFFAQWTWAVCTLPLVVYCIYQVIGNAIWAGVGSMLLGGILLRHMSQLAKPVVLAAQERRDVRSQLIKEILSSISAIKLQTGEEEWLERVKAARRAEMKEIFKIRLISAFTTIIGTMVYVAVPVAIFTWYTLVDGHKLDSTTAFTTLAWIAQMRWSINVLPDIYNMYAQLSPSCERLARFFNDESGGGPRAWLYLENDDDHDEEVDGGGEGTGAWTDGNNSFTNNRTPDNGQTAANAPAIHLCGTLGYRAAGHVQAEPKIVLKDVDIAIRRGSFTIVVGAVGAGKSTLLAALSRGLPVLDGKCSTSGTRAYVSQLPFLLNDTVESNICFGEPLDEARFQQCVHDAALGQDLEALQDGRFTVIGEKGVQLSGGQKARLALARALYRDADLYFLDDVLSAVDATTGQFIWQNTLAGGLARQGKTIVLVTHQLQYLTRPEVDLVAAVDDGRVVLGTWQEVRSQVHTDISSFAETSKPSAEGEKKEESHANGHISEDHQEGAESDTLDRAEEQRPEAELVTLAECEARVQALLEEQRDRVLDNRLVDELMAALRGESSHEEKRQVGLIAWRDFRVYLQAFGTKSTLVALACIIIATAVSNVVMNVWLSVWGDKPDASQGYLYVYMGLGLASAVLAGLEIIILALCAFAASQVLHEVMIHTLIGASMGYFNRTPSGQVQNRFLQDLANIDMGVPDCIVDQVKKTLNMVTQIGLVVLFAPWVILTLPFLMIPYFLVFGTVRCAARDSRRLEAMAHSPVYTQFSDILRGKLCIRAFAVEPRFEAWNRDLVNAMARGKYANEAVSKWAQTLTTQNGCLLYLSCGIVSVFLIARGSMTQGQLGLVLLYSAQLQRASMDYMMGLTNVETNFVSVERIAGFMRTPDEFDQDARRLEKLQRARRACSIDSGAADIEAPRRVWPSHGGIEVRDLCMRYALHRRRVLNGLNFSVLGGEKVALCGRTGCGKSSTFGILCRLFPMSAGEVRIDGVDINEVPLRELRSAIRVITQDSVLVAGTLRSNLASGRDGVSEADLWDALSKVQMRTFVEAQEGGLDCIVEDGGRNLSVGQRQLLCTARALLPRNGAKPRILLCDEPTANIDLASDVKIHDVLLGLDATVVMICHRLQHVPRFDRVVVMAPGGTLQEQGPPSDLLSRPNSALRDLFERAGIST
ncbi:ABC transporter, putative [Hondaea fermentalgiana]|uniref:ABC transporter, putative n=1 Tax=Hondaea fermentalgiana TaxID=2315210 RepID=A0A2R5G5X1_9STRA|nr:ABC transporter, putative [Hondaea fermentalgiana]|eukprot:GBG26436.1 ABC transporter, putative [Hondaea fermentalgiana]